MSLSSSSENLPNDEANESMLCTKIYVGGWVKWHRGWRCLSPSLKKSGNHNLWTCRHGQRRELTPKSCPLTSSCFRNNSESPTLCGLLVHKGSPIDQTLGRFLSDFCFPGPQPWPSDTWTNTHFLTVHGLIVGMTLFFFKIPGWENSVSKKGHCLFQLPPEDRVPAPCFPVLVGPG